jgi:hypothetical protein
MHSIVAHLQPWGGPVRSTRAARTPAPRAAPACTLAACTPPRAARHAGPALCADSITATTLMSLRSPRHPQFYVFLLIVPGGLTVSYIAYAWPMSKWTPAK